MKLYPMLVLCALALPSFSNDTSSSQPPPPVQKDKSACADGGKKIVPGDVHTNGAGVTHTNKPDSGGNATLTPKGGNASCPSNVTTKTGAKGDTTGLKTGDTATLGSSNTQSVTGTGGTVSISGGSAVTITCTGPVSNYITVLLPGGNTSKVWGGSSATFNT